MDRESKTTARKAHGTKRTVKTLAGVPDVTKAACERDGHIIAFDKDDWEYPPFPEGWVASN
jgi:hypothetical protein